MPAKHARRHPGVVLIKPEPERRIGWRARYRDPDSCSMVKETVPAILRTREAREDWAARKSRALAKRRLELSEGAPRATGTALQKAIDSYYEANPRLRDKTLRGYRAATDKLARWATRSGVQTTDDLTRANLMKLREQLINEPKRSAAKGGKRGARVISDGGQRSAFSVNRELAALRTVLGYLNDRDLLSKIREGDLRRAFKKLPTAIERIDFLQTAELKALLSAAQKHDAATFKATRAEHAGNGRHGATPKFDPIAPMVAIILLSGMRLNEALTLDWSQVDLDALDNNGQPVGEIRLTGATKTKRARTIDLAVSPALRAILKALPGRHEGKVLKVTADAAKATVERLRTDFGAPPIFTWQALRATCGTYLTNAPGIFGAASAYRSARQLGHSVAIAERHYLGLVRGIPATARTLDAAMGLEAELAGICRN